LNDQFRTTFRGGKVLPSVSAMPDMVKAAALHKVATFTDFNEANNPHGENDFIKFELCNRSFIFVISYYDLTMEFGSYDPSDPSVTTRVGTLMSASDW
jgi:hypothetical protein